MTYENSGHVSFPVTRFETNARANKKEEKEVDLWKQWPLKFSGNTFTKTNACANFKGSPEHLVNGRADIRGRLQGTMNKYYATLSMGRCRTLVPKHILTTCTHLRAGFKEASTFQEPFWTPKRWLYTNILAMYDQKYMLFPRSKQNTWLSIFTQNLSLKVDL